jgi:hypothetical protein
MESVRGSAPSENWSNSSEVQDGQLAGELCLLSGQTGLIGGRITRVGGVQKHFLLYATSMGWLSLKDFCLAPTEFLYFTSYTSIR